MVGLPNGNCAASPVIVSGTPKSGNLSVDTTLFFSFNLSGQVYQNNLTVVAQITTTPSTVTYPNGALVLRIRRGNSPTTVIYDASASSNGTQQLVITLLDPLPGAYYVSLYNNQTTSLSYSVDFWNSTCAQGKAGPFCNSTVIDLSGAPNTTQYTGTGFYQYFRLKNATDLIIGTGTESLKETAPALLASYLNYPTNSSYMIQATDGTTNFILAEATSLVDWKIAVWAYEGQEYYLWVNMYCPNDCQGDNFDNSSNTTNGNCNEITGICACNSGFQDIYCSSSGLAVVWIVLIVIAGAIILAVAIGVPVACYLRNRQRTRYERV